MSYSITNAKTDLSGILKGTSVNKVTGISSLFDRAARQLLLDVDPSETKRKQQIASAIFDSVYDYAVPVDLKGNKIIDIRQQVNRGIKDKFTQTYSQNFDQYKTVDDNMFQVASNKGVKTVRVKKDMGGLILLNNSDSLTANGTWTASADAINLAADTLTYVSGSGSLKFDVDGSTTTATLTNVGMTAVDLTDHEDEATIFAWVYLPDASTVTSIQLRWGSDATNYWSASATAAFSGAFQNGWNQIGVNWNGATQTLSPIVSAVDYLQVNITYDGVADTGYRLDSISSNKGSIFDIVYYSKYLFTDGTTGAWKETVSDDSDTVNLDTESYNLFLFKAAEFASQQIETLKDDTPYFAGKYNSDVRRYKSMYKGETVPAQNFYYRMR